MHRTVTRFSLGRVRSGTRFAAGIFAIVAMVAFATQATAGTFNYGNLSGNTVSFVDVEETSTSDPNALYGTPTVAGDALLFQSPNFISASSAGASDITEGILTMSVVADPGRSINLVAASEVGNWLLTGTGGALTSASVTPTLTVLPYFGATPLPGVIPPITLAIAPSPPPFTLAGGTLQGSFNGSAIVDLVNTYFLVGVTRVDISFTNLLETSSESNSSALIQKSFESLASVTVESGGGGPIIPEPSSFALVMALVSVLGFVRRRRS